MGQDGNRVVSPPSRRWRRHPHRTGRDRRADRLLRWHRGTRDRPGRGRERGRRRGVAGRRPVGNRGQRAALVRMREPARRDGVRLAPGPAELRGPRRPQDHDRAFHGPRDGAEEPAAGRDARQPRRPRRARPVAGRRHRHQPQSAGGRGLRHRRLRPTRGRRIGAGAELRSRLLLRQPAGLHPGERGGGAGAHQQGEDLRGGLRAAVRLAAALRDQREHGPRHGPDTPGVRRAEDHLLRVLLGHLPGPGVRHAVPQPGPQDGARQHGGPDRCLVPGQHRPGLRLPGPARRVLRVDREIRQRLQPGQHGRRGAQRLLPGA